MRIQQLIWLLLFFPGFGFFLLVEANQAELSKQQLKQLRQQIAKAQKSLVQIKKSQQTHTDRLKQIDLEINRLVRQIHHLDEKIERLSLQIQELKDKIDTNQDHLQKQKEILAQHLSASYFYGQQEFVKLLLNQEDPARFSRIMSYYRYINQARVEQIEKVQTLLQTLQQQEEELALLQQQLELQHYLKENEKAQLVQQQQYRNEQLQLLSQQEKNVSNNLEQLYKDEQQLKKLLENIILATKKIAFKTPKRPFSQLKNQLYWPLRGKIRKLFNRWRSYKKVRWQGNIILSPEGRDVYSIADGRVVYADWLRGYGLLTIIDHGQKYMSLYAYSQALLTEVGDQVQAGEVIAKAGRTSGRKKAGIYFEIRKNGKPVNPAIWCRKLPPGS